MAETTQVYVLVFRDSKGYQLTSRVFSSLPSSDDVREVGVADLDYLQEAEFRLEDKGEKNFEVVIYEGGLKNPDIWGYLWEEEVHHPSRSTAPEELPRMGDIHFQYYQASRGRETELWVLGDPNDMNDTDIVARLTDAERVQCAPQLAILSRYARDLDDWGNDLRSKLRSRFDNSRREHFLRRHDWTPEELEALEAWYRFPSIIQDRLVSSFS